MNTKPKVMVLGTFHMRYTPDLQHVELDDVLLNDRQNEIKEVVNSLKEFKPTKIALEVEKDKNESLNEEFRKYLNEDLALEVDEIHQFGFRLASELHHNELYAVDWMDNVGNLGLGQVMEWAKNEQPDMYQHINDTYRTKLQLNMDPPNIYEMVKQSNSESRVQLDHEMYMAIARIGRETSYIGIDWVRWWYQRNLIIYSNLAELSTLPDDRTLLIIGSGHVHLVTQFLKESGLVDVVSPNEYFQ
ncbi:DUF5694 domain-containing protein [Rossellomorea sp. SC111]|uniref:DUF5694 domain-containing protein n=1 Tax=Rossellomorea sp. SC111 TaxID=2968985 RepID=UPI00215A8523|nr:DUF5694 domain-containing protein [Rossellomorea sp. SC111]MCR8849396.1 DUF5694 domain-containing protein [Rossellomorea sp. SC111]